MASCRVHGNQGPISCKNCQRYAGDYMSVVQPRIRKALLKSEPIQNKMDIKLTREESKIYDDFMLRSEGKRKELPDLELMYYDPITDRNIYGHTWGRDYPKGRCVGPNYKPRDIRNLEKSGLGVGGFSSDFLNPAVQVLPYNLLQKLAKSSSCALPRNSKKDILVEEMSKSKYAPLRFNEAFESLNQKQLKTHCKSLGVDLKGKGNVGKQALIKMIISDLKKKERIVNRQAQEAKLPGYAYDLVSSYL